MKLKKINTQFILCNSLLVGQRVWIHSLEEDATQ